MNLRAPKRSEPIQRRQFHHLDARRSLWELSTAFVSWMRGEVRSCLCRWYGAGLGLAWSQYGLYHKMT